jgi:AraC-like DNA-binding protein
MTRAGDEALAEIADAIGLEAAMALALRFGGTRLCVPKVIGEHHPIRVALGKEVADKLAEWAGGGSLDVPKQAARRARVHDLHRKGALTIQQIAIETHYTERHVYRLLRATRDDCQLSLFD